MTTFSKLATSSQTQAVASVRESEKTWPPPIPFAFKSSKNDSTTKSSKSSDDDENDKTKVVKFDVPLDPTDKEGATYVQSIKTFSDGNPEELITYLKEMEQLFRNMGVANDYPFQHRLYQATLKDKAKEHYIKAYNQHNSTNEALTERRRVSEEVVMGRVINELSKQYFNNWRSAVRQQKNYMRTKLIMSQRMHPKVFIDRMTKMNQMLPYFPVDMTRGLRRPLPMEEDELLDILDNAKKLEWTITMMSQGKRPDSFETLEEAQEYYEQLHTADQIRQKLSGKTSKDPSKKSDFKRKRDSDQKAGKKAPKCSNCGKTGHLSKDCWTLPENKDKRPSKRHKSSQKTFTKAQTTMMLNQVYHFMKARDAKPNPKKRQVTYEPEENSETEADAFMAKLNLESNDDSSVSASSTNSASDSSSN